MSHDDERTEFQADWDEAEGADSDALDEKDGIRLDEQPRATPEPWNEDEAYALDERAKGLAALDAVDQDEADQLYNALPAETRRRISSTILGGVIEWDAARIWWVIAQAKDTTPGSLRRKPVKRAVEATEVLVALDTRPGRPPASKVTHELLKLAGEVYGFCTEFSSQIGNTDPYCGVELRNEAVPGELRLEKKCPARGAHRVEIARHDRDQALARAIDELEKAYNTQSDSDRYGPSGPGIGHRSELIWNALQQVQTMLTLLGEIDPRTDRPES